MTPAFSGGRFLRKYVYRFIELCAPALTEQVIRASDSQRQASAPEH